MAGWIDLTGAVEANTVYSEGQLVAKDVTINLPAITPVTADFKAMGTLSLPIIGQLESMEFSVTKIGVDHGLSKLLKLQVKTIECRWVQNVISADGAEKMEGCKAFLRVVPKSIPGIGLEVGKIPENDITAEVTRYQVFVGGQELWLIDRLAQILRIDGVDYYQPIKSLL
jgi:phage tail tube protein FII